MRRETTQHFDNISDDVIRLVKGAGSERGSIRIGIDVVSICGFRALMDTRGGKAFVRSRFTQAELDYCENRPERLSARWAAKEAVAKAIGSGFRGIRPRDIEIGHENWGQPIVRSSNGIAWPEGSQDWTWSVSLAHEGDAAVAIAIAVLP